MRSDSGSSKQSQFIADAVHAAVTAAVQASKPAPRVRASGSGRAGVGTQQAKPATPKPAAPARPVRAAGSGSAKVGVEARRLTGAVHGSGKAKTSGGGTLPLATVTKVTNASRYLNPVMLAASAVNAAPDVAGSKRISGDLVKALKVAPKDAAELAVTTPSSLYHLATTAAHDPMAAGKQLVQPYGDLVKHPEAFLTTHPVSASLMVLPAARVPGRIAGATLRVAGKQALAREPAVLPGTALRVERVKSRDAFRNAAQTRKDANASGPVIATSKQVGKRVDQAFDAGRGHRARVRQSAAQQVKDRGMAPDQAKEHMSGASAGASDEIARRFVREFGSTWSRDPKTGALMKPKNAQHGVLYESRAEAQDIVDKLKSSNVPYEPVVFEAGNKFGVVPRQAADRFGWHGRVGTSPAVGAVVLRESRKAFGRTVLPFSKNFLPGQGFEAGLRAALEGAGPTSWLRAKKVIAAMPEADRRALLDRTVGDKTLRTGHAGHAMEYMGHGGTLAESFGATGSPTLAAVGKAATKVGESLPLKPVRAAYHAWSDVVFNKVNATIERNAQTAMLGKAIKQSPLMERRVLGLTKKAIDEAAQGLTHTESQARASAELDRMYGQYRSFSPQMREAIMHTTPFVPWYINTARLLLRLPLDHPIHASLAASLAKAEEDWRKAHGFSLRGGKPVRAFEFGGPLGRWGPFVPKDVGGTAGGVVIPQLEPSLATLVQGVDWKGGKVNGSKVLQAALQLLEAHIPASTQIDKATGIGDTYVNHAKDAKSVFNGKTLDEVKRDLLKQVDVTRPFTQKAKIAGKKTGGGSGAGGVFGSGGSSGGGGVFGGSGGGSSSVFK